MEADRDELSEKMMRKVDSGGIIMWSHFKVKKRQPKASILRSIQSSNHKSTMSSSSKMLLSLFLLFVVIPSLPLDKINHLNNLNNLATFAQASNLAETKQTPTTSQNASLPSSNTNNNISNNQTTSTSTSTTTEFLLNLVKTNFANHTTGARFALPPKVRPGKVLFSQDLST